MNFLFFSEDLDELQKHRGLTSVKHREAGAACGEASEQAESFGGHDNAPFEAAMLDMSIASRKLGELDEMLSRAVIAVPKPNDGSVQFGRVVLIDDLTLHEKTWYIIGSPWTKRTGEGTSKEDPMPTSYISPISRALMGHRVSEEIVFQKRKLKILEIC